MNSSLSRCRLPSEHRCYCDRPRSSHVSGSCEVRAEERWLLFTCLPYLRECDCMLFLHEGGRQGDRRGERTEVGTLWSNWRGTELEIWWRHLRRENTNRNIRIRCDFQVLPEYLIPQREAAPHRVSTLLFTIGGKKWYVHTLHSCQQIMRLIHANVLARFCFSGNE